MDGTLSEQERRLALDIERETGRLRSFIRNRVRDLDDAEDILQDVFYELVLASRLMRPVEQVGAWLYRVARNRIIDLFRKRAAEPVFDLDEATSLEEILPALGGGPEAAFTRTVLMKELEAALEEIPAAQREAFIAHELGGESFAQISARTGVGVNTLLSRKRYAVLHLRGRLEELYGEIKKG